MERNMNILIDRIDQIASHSGKEHLVLHYKPQSFPIRFSSGSSRIFKKTQISYKLGCSYDGSTPPEYETAVLTLVHPSFPEEIFTFEWTNSSDQLPIQLNGFTTFITLSNLDDVMEFLSVTDPVTRKEEKEKPTLVTLPKEYLDALERFNEEKREMLMEIRDLRLAQAAKKGGRPKKTEGKEVRDDVRD